jgi:hypothetical protein
MNLSNDRITDLTDTFGRFILNCLTHLTPEQQSTLAYKSRGSGGSEVTLTIDGIEVPVEQVIVKWVEWQEALLEERALNLLSDKMDSIKGILIDAQEEIDKSIINVKEKVAESFDFTYDSWDDRFVKDNN